MKKIGVVGILVILVASLCLGSLALAQEQLAIGLSLSQPLLCLVCFLEEAVKEKAIQTGNRSYIFGSRG